MICKLCGGLVKLHESTIDELFYKAVCGKCFTEGGRVLVHESKKEAETIAYNSQKRCAMDLRDKCYAYVQTKARLSKR